MDRTGAFAVDPLAIHGKERPHSIELEPAIRPDACLRHADRVEPFDGVEANVRQPSGVKFAGHSKILADSRARHSDCFAVGPNEFEVWLARRLGDKEGCTGKRGRGRVVAAPSGTLAAGGGRLRYRLIAASCGFTHRVQRLSSG